MPKLAYRKRVPTEGPGSAILDSDPRRSYLGLYTLAGAVSGHSHHLQVLRQLSSYTILSSSSSFSSSITFQRHKSLLASFLPSNLIAAGTVYSTLLPDSLYIRIPSSSNNQHWNKALPNITSFIYIIILQLSALNPRSVQHIKTRQPFN